MTVLFCALIRTMGQRTKNLSPCFLSLDNKNKKAVFCFVLCSLIRTFAQK